MCGPAGHGQVVGTVLEPTRIGVAMEMAGPSGQFSLDVSNIRLNLSPDILELALSLQSSVLEPLIQPPAEQPVSKCSLFVKVATQHCPRPWIACWPCGGQRVHDVLMNEHPRSGAWTCCCASLRACIQPISGGSPLLRHRLPILFCWHVTVIQLRQCSVRKVWSTAPQPQTGTLALLDTDVLAGRRGLTFWRPQPPVGYAVLGDCVTAGTSQQPTFQVWPVKPPPLVATRTHHPLSD